MRGCAWLGPEGNAAAYALGECRPHPALRATFSPCTGRRGAPSVIVAVIGLIVAQQLAAAGDFRLDQRTGIGGVARRMGRRRYLLAFRAELARLGPTALI